MSYLNGQQPYQGKSYLQQQLQQQQINQQATTATAPPHIHQHQPQQPYIQQYSNNTPIYNNNNLPYIQQIHTPQVQQQQQPLQPLQHPQPCYSILQPILVPNQQQPKPQIINTPTTSTYQPTPQQLQQVKQQQIMQQTIQQQQQLQQINIEQSFQNYLSKIKDKFEKFSSHHVGVENRIFEAAPLPTTKDCNQILLKLQSNRNIHTSLLPFTLPSENYIPPEFFTQIDIIQYHLSGLASILVLIKLSNDKSNLLRSLGVMIAKSNFMIEKLAKLFQTKLDNHNASLSSMTASTTLNASVLSSQRNNNPIIMYFMKQSEYITQLKKYSETGEITVDAMVYFTQSLFSMFTSKGYFWYIDEINQLVKSKIFDSIYSNLQRCTVNNTTDSKYKYYFGCYCYSFFKITQITHEVTSNRFVNFKTHKPPAKDEAIYKYLLFYLECANKSLVEAFVNPISDSLYWLIYAKTCCLLDQEEKAHLWIQYYINEATDRVTAASTIQLDADISHYNSKSWYIEIMKSIEDEKRKRIEEDDKIAKARLAQQQAAKQAAAIAAANGTSIDEGFVVLPNSNGSPHIVGGQIADQYSEIKTNLLLEGLVLKNMNHDATLISSNVLLNLHPPLQSKEVEMAQSRLNERLELYMLKNSKEIPGDGNCQMHALSDQLYGDLSHSQDVRKTIVDWLRSNKDFSLPNGATICQFVNTNNWDDYCNDMSKNGNWGDHLTLLAAAELYGSKISIISSVESQSNFFIEIIPTKIRNDKVLLLSHYAEFHYGSLCPLR